MVYLYLDDERTPKTDKDWIIIRSYKEAVAYIKENPCPDYISFDHDLGTEETGFTFTKALVDYDLDHYGEYIPEDFKFNVHSANPIGARNIENYLLNYLKERKGICPLST